MNVLFIPIDDLKAIGTLYSEEEGDFLSFVYPDPELRKAVARRMTPNIQRLADSGVAFMHAYCASPACNPSRAAIMTGIRPHRTGLTSNAGAVFFRDFEYEGERPLADAVTLPELLQAAGWYTASTGKIYHSGADFEKSDGNRSWTDWTSVSGGAGQKERSRFSPASLPWGQEGDDEATYHKLNDYRTADFIARVLEKGLADNGSDRFSIKGEEPFFLACGIFRPHLPFYATKDLLDLFPVDEMTLSEELLEYFVEDGRDLPEDALRWIGITLNDAGDPVIGKERFVDILTQGNRVAGPGGDLAGWKDMLMHYFASCAIADRAVGRLLDGLDASPYRDNTMVILWSDHGFHLGEKIHQTKFTLWDDGSRVNFLIRDPRYPEAAGQRCFRPVSLVDIYPTVTAMAGLELPDPRISGRDLTPLLMEPAGEWTGYAHTTLRGVFNNMLRVDRWKLIRYQNNNSSLELYDMVADPEEYHNLTGLEEFAEVRDRMLQRLEAALAEE